MQPPFRVVSLKREHVDRAAQLLAEHFFEAQADASKWRELLVSSLRLPRHELAAPVDERNRLIGVASAVPFTEMVSRRHPLHNRLRVEQVPPRDTALYVNLVVDLPRRFRGVGTALVDFLDERVSQNGFQHAVGLTQLDAVRKIMGKRRALELGDFEVRGKAHSAFLWSLKQDV